ncbi:MAG: SIS domain-containing protein [Deltaproteobacteria bacterium]|jgi:D-sedoheptulose 7-phosphate isomerase|nr:SIS domain-containing protein [Deltaproteobacteria bacterium]
MILGNTTVTNSLLESKVVLDALICNEKAISSIAAAGEQLISAFRRGGRVFVCGNGGSMCDSIHFAEELSGRYRDNRKGLPAIAISDPGHLSCVGNDYGYEHVFSRYLEAHARQGDVLVGISTSGKSINVIKAAEYAQHNNMSVITLTGHRESHLSSFASIDICAPAGKYADRVQELHIKVIHILIELVERELFPENYN